MYIVLFFLPPTFYLQMGCGLLHKLKPSPHISEELALFLWPAVKSASAEGRRALNCETSCVQCQQPGVAGRVWWNCLSDAIKPVPVSDIIRKTRPRQEQPARCPPTQKLPPHSPPKCPPAPPHYGCLSQTRRTSADVCSPPSSLPSLPASSELEIKKSCTSQGNLHEPPQHILDTSLNIKK